MPPTPSTVVHDEVARADAARVGRRALVVIAGDDVYEDLFTASCELQDLLASLGFVARVRIGTAALQEVRRGELVVLYTAGAPVVGAQLDALRSAVESGGGLVSIHSSVLPQGDDYDRLAGVVFRSHGPLPHEGDIVLRVEHGHPLAPDLAGVDGAVIAHEHYRTELLPGVRVAVWRDAPYGPEPLLTANRVGRGRVCWVQFGHDMAAWDEPAVRSMVGAAVDWADPDGAADLPHGTGNED